ncbi:MAG: hypothetical protein SFW67_33765 [Myxococcaceae bacterium]|nr:hypothetical protein [Myxococcaceae bacterium]
MKNRAALAVAVLISTMVVIPHAAAEAALAFGEHLAAPGQCVSAPCMAPGAAPSLVTYHPPHPPVVTGVRVEHRLVLAALGYMPPGQDEPAWRLEGAPLPALKYANMLFGQPFTLAQTFTLEHFIAQRLVRQRPNKLAWILAQLALARRLHESWTLEARAQAAVDHWSVSGCGHGLEEAARVCFGKPLSALPAEAIAALVAHETRHASAVRAGYLLGRAGLPAGVIPPLPVPPRHPSEPEIDE